MILQWLVLFACFFLMIQGVVSILAGPFQIGKSTVITPGDYLLDLFVHLAKLLVAAWGIHLLLSLMVGN